MKTWRENFDSTQHRERVWCTQDRQFIWQLFKLEKTIFRINNEMHLLLLLFFRDGVECSKLQSSKTLSSKLHSSKLQKWNYKVWHYITLWERKKLFMNICFGDKGQLLSLKYSNCIPCHFKNQTRSPKNKLENRFEPCHLKTLYQDKILTFVISNFLPYRIFNRKRNVT